MTDDYKSELRNYLTNKINIETWPNHPLFSGISIYRNNLYTFISRYATQPQTSTYHLIKGKDGNGNELDEHLLYGIDEYDNSSFIVVLDNIFNPIQFINKYSSGTKFGIFENMIIDDDGRFYGVENVNGTRRFVMLNNILIKASNQLDYRVVLRQSYNLPSSLQSGTIKQLIKKPLGNKYLFCANTSNTYPLLVELTINVGASNEWVTYSYSTNHCSITGAWASWDNNDNLSFKLACTYTSGNTGYLYIFINSNNAITQQNRFNLPDPQASWIQAIVLNESTIYLGYCTTDNSGVYNQYICRVDSAITQIFKSPNTDIAMPGSLIKSDLYTDGYNVFLSFNVPNADDTIDYYMGVVYNDEVYYINFGDLTYTTTQMLYATNTFHQFNLYSYYLQLGDTSYVGISIFNNLNYNGLPYTDFDELRPKSVILSNDIGTPLFARNLYNKVINDNVTVATVEIPNTLMNYDLGPAYEIAQQSLLGETNIELVHANEVIVKNIYETVDINFYNTITMIDRNDENNPVQNMAGAIRLNKSASNNLDYGLAGASKVKINYTDGTNYMVAIDPSTQITISNGKAIYSFIIYAPTHKFIKNLEIVSYDEMTSYATINGTFVKGKYYQITQEVWVE